MVFFVLLLVASVQAVLKLNSGQYKTLNPTGTTPVARAWHTGASVGGIMYVIGGELNPNTGQPEYFTDMYNPATNAWGSLGSAGKLPGNIVASDMDSLGGLLFMFGGINDQNQNMLNDIYVLHPSAPNGWQFVFDNDAIPPRNGHSTCALGGEVFVFGGWDETQYFSDLWSFDVSSLYLNNPANWTITLASGPAGRDGQSMVAYGADLFISVDFGIIFPMAHTSTALPANNVPGLMICGSILVVVINGLKSFRVVHFRFLVMATLQLLLGRICMYLVVIPSEVYY